MNRLATSAAACLWAIALQTATTWHALAVDVGTAAFEVRLAGVALSIPSRAAVDVRSDAGAIHAEVDATADLGDLQAKALEVARALPLPKDNCARDGVNPVVDSVDSARISTQPGVAVIDVSGHVTAWACAKVAGTRIKTKVASDTVALTIPVRPVVIGPRELGLKLAGPPKITTGNVATEKAARAILGDLDAKLASSLSTLLTANTAKADLSSIVGLDVALDHADFVEVAGVLGLHLKGHANATGAALTELITKAKP